MKNINMEAPGSRALLALEATVRLGSATLAAEQLNVTQTAISHRIRELEEMIGQPLFVRQGRGLEPTPAAHILADAVRHSSHFLQEALSAIGRPQVSGTLTVSMLPALASKWLAPRLIGMLQEFPSVDLRVTASRNFVDFSRDRVDVAIRYGRGQWRGVRSRHLCDEWLAPVIAPNLLKRMDLSSIHAFADLPLIRSDNPDTWERWFEATPFQQPPQQANRIFFDDDTAMIEAVASGIGVALGRAALVAHDIRSGRLVAPFRYVIPSRFSYWFVQDQDRTETHIHQAFYQWSKIALHKDTLIFDPGSSGSKPID